jgi:hypothetical protein
MAGGVVQIRRRGWLETSRRDAWWVMPLVVFTILSAFVIYSTWAAFQNAHYQFGNYLSPFYSPLIFGDGPDSWFGPKPGWWPGFVPFSPALLILPFPAGFRLTCYYYRGAYYKAFWSDPPNCAVGEPRKSYRGERSFPLVIQNIHRYFLYFALIFLIFLGHDAWKAMWFTAPDGRRTFGVGLGTILLTANVVLLAGYTFGCHSLRHIVGGYLDRLAGAPVRRTAYVCVSCFNRAHMRWAWASLLVVAFCDIYVRMLSMGIWHDVRLF